MRRFVCAVASALLMVAAATFIPGAATSAYAAGDFDLYALRSSGLHIASGSCRHVTVTAKTTAPYWVDDMVASVDLWLDNEQVDHVDLYPTSSPQSLSGAWYFCPALDDPGTYRLGTTEVTWYDRGSNSRSFIDSSTGTLVAKQATRTSFSATQTGPRTFHAHPGYFYSGWDSRSYDGEGWYSLSTGTKLNLQRRPATGTGSWNWVATQRVDAQGWATFKVRATKSFQYRVIWPGTTITWQLAGPVLRR